MRNVLDICLLYKKIGTGVSDEQTYLVPILSQSYLALGE